MKIKITSTRNGIPDYCVGKIYEAREYGGMSKQLFIFKCERASGWIATLGINCELEKKKPKGFKAFALKHYSNDRRKV